jgi:hypothetical protein
MVTLSLTSGETKKRKKRKEERNPGSGKMFFSLFTLLRIMP